MHASEHADSWPATGASTNTWDTALMPYVNLATNVYPCPSDPFKLPTGDGLSYAVNACGNDCPFSRSGNLQAPAKLRDFDNNKGDLILLADSLPTSAAAHARLGQSPAAALNFQPSTMHSKGAGGNYLMATFSVQYIRVGDSTKNISTTSGPGDLWTFYAP